MAVSAPEMEGLRWMSRGPVCGFIIGGRYAGFCRPGVEGLAGRVCGRKPGRAGAWEGKVLWEVRNPVDTFCIVGIESTITRTIDHHLHHAYTHPWLRQHKLH